MAAWESADGVDRLERRRQARAAALRAQRRRRRVGVVVVAVAAVVAIAVLLGRGGGAPERAADAPAPNLAAVHASADLAGRELRDDPQTRAVRRVLAYTPVITRGGGRGRREIALTFDDGPGPYTKAIVRALASRRAPATFFVVGSQMRTFHGAAATAVAAGDAIGIHTESHAHLAGLPLDALRDELVTPIQWLSKYHLPGAPLLRPPYGSYDAATLAELKRRGMLLVLWSVDTGDYTRPGVDAIVRRALAGARPGAIILLHDGGGDRAQTVAAVPQIMHRLRLRDYHLVTVPQLLADDPPPDGQPIPRLQTEG